MLKRIFTCSLLSFAFISCVFSQSTSGENKPVLKLDVLIDGKEFSILDGDTLKYDSKSIVIRTSQYMTFDFEALKFDFPKHFSNQFEHGDGYKTWTLDGNDFVIMYFIFDIKVERDAFIKEMVDKFGKKNCTLSDRRTKLGTIDLSGKRINIALAGVKITYDIFSLNTDDGKTHYIAFQDTKGDDGSESQEGLETLDVLNKTIKLKQ
jgi:hypothetical protein